MTGGPVPSIRQWSVSRNRNEPDWNEDAGRGEITGDGGAWRAFLVVADGAGSTAFAGAWARALVEAADARWISGGLIDGLHEVRAAFDPLAVTEHEVDFVLEDLWHERGSAATFVVAEAYSTESGTMCHALAVGDCLLLASEPHTLSSFPAVAASQFSNRTRAVKSQPSDFEAAAWTCTLPPGSMLALTSDALGAWLLSKAEIGGPADVYAWLRVVSEDALPDLDDDVTLVLLDVPDREPQRLHRLAAFPAFPTAWFRRRLRARSRR